MSLTRDIAATYRRPRQVVARLHETGAHEGRALVFLMTACFVIFIAQWPAAAREAHLTGSDLGADLGATLFAVMFIAPLVFYIIGFISFLVLRPFAPRVTGFGARIALFWALIASSPVMLLWGLVAGFIGSGLQLDVVGVLWWLLFLWFWIAGLGWR